MEKSISYQHGKLLCFLTLQEVQQVIFHQRPKFNSLNGPSKFKQLVSLNEMNASAPDYKDVKAPKILTEGF